MYFLFQCTLVLGEQILQLQFKSIQMIEMTLKERGKSKSLHLSVITLVCEQKTNLINIEQDAGYTFDVRIGTALDQVPFSLLHTSTHNIRVLQKISKIVLGFEVESLHRDNPLLGVAIYICTFWGLHKQINKTNQLLLLGTDLIGNLQPNMGHHFSSCYLGQI